MSSTAYVWSRSNYETPARMEGPLGRALCEVGEATVLLDWVVTIRIGGEDVEVHVEPEAFRAFQDFERFAFFMARRCPHWAGGQWPSLLERGFRPLQLSFESGDVFLAGGPLLLTRADVVDELDAADILAEYTPPDMWGGVNYRGAYNSMQELMA